MNQRGLPLFRVTLLTDSRGAYLCRMILLVPVLGGAALRFYRCHTIRYDTTARLHVSVKTCKTDKKEKKEIFFFSFEKSAGALHNHIEEKRVTLQSGNPQQHDQPRSSSTTQTKARALSVVALLIESATTPKGL